MTIDEAFQLALQHHQSGRLAEAEALYRQILAAAPQHADALHLLGVIAHQVGRSDVAVGMITQAIALSPGVAAYHSNLGEAFRVLGQYEEAVAAFGRALRIEPDFADALGNLGLALARLGRTDEAIASLRRAVALAPGSAETLSNLGGVLGEKGLAGEAIACFRRAIELKPGHPDAFYNLGNLLASEHRPEEAAAAYRQALASRPDYPGAHYNFGVVLGECDRIEECIAAYREAVRLRPGHIDSQVNLGNALLRKGCDAEAVELYRAALRAKPDHAGAHFNLANVMAKQGHFSEAVAGYREALRCDPGRAEALNNLGGVLVKMGRNGEAAEAFHGAVDRRPDFGEAWNNLGGTLSRLDRHAEALEACQQAIRWMPESAVAHYNLGFALAALEHFHEAIASYREAVRLDPDYAEARSNLGTVLVRLGLFGEAIAEHRRALERRPDLAEIWSNLGVALKDAGRIAESLAADRRALEIQPDFAKARSNLLLDLHYAPGAEPAEIFAEHRRWDEMHGAAQTGAAAPHGNDRDPERRLRVGMVSPDFREHSVAFFVEALLEHHDRAQVEVTCYSDTKRADAFTARIRGSTAQWRDIHGMPDEKVAALIREDAIDILVDLAGHTADNRLLAFARKPAPVQVTWLGYCDTTGLRAMDWRLTDAHADPPGTTEHLHTEKLWRLPETFACFRPAENAPAVSALPALTRGRVTFASFHTLAKLNDPLLELWSAILKAVPDSRLLMVSAGLDDASVRGRLVEFFANRGLDAKRVEFRGKQSLADYFALHSEVDVLLDSHPFSGHTVSCHALWMGVPVVTLSGATHCSRMVTSVLSNLGCPEWIAAAPEEYVSIATGLASDLSKLAEIRAGLRAKMAASPLTGGPRFARNVEQAYREMWRAWCARASEKGSP